MMKKLLVLVLALATTFIVACGDNHDSRLTDADVVCLKRLNMGLSCGAATGSGATTTATQTVTVTTTNTSTSTTTI
jgi:hypothetical protein